MILNKNYKRLFIAFTVLGILALSSQTFAVEYFLRAGVTQLTMPDGEIIPMWGFAQDSSFGAGDGVITVPGPALEVLPGDSNLIIHLDNNLPEPVSVVIHGQIANMVPVKFQDSKGRMRIKSFTHETAPGNATAVDYSWTNVKPGTYMYQSGSHAAIQVPMGLYGCMKKDYVTGFAYHGVQYDSDLFLCFSEIDPVINNAVSSGNFGPGKDVSSIIDWVPRYFLINGKPYSAGQLPTVAGQVEEKILLRFVNAGIQTHSPVLNDFYGMVVAEDAFLYTYPKEQYSLMLSAAKTKDVIITPDMVGDYAVYDRRLRLTNSTNLAGGMLTFISVTGKSADLNFDGTVDVLDLGLFLESWLHEGHVCPANFTGIDNKVDLVDYEIFASQFDGSGI